MNFISESNKGKVHNHSVKSLTMYGFSKDKLYESRKSPLIASYIPVIFGQTKMTISSFSDITYGLNLCLSKYFNEQVYFQNKGTIK